MNMSLLLTLASVFVASILGIVLVDAMLTHPRKRDLAPPPDPTPRSTTDAATDAASPSASEPTETGQS
jgi:hypothetical protein